MVFNNESISPLQWGGAKGPAPAKIISAFPGVQAAPLKPENGVIRLHIFVDRASVEVFANDGRVVLTDPIFPGAQSHRPEIFSDGGEASLGSLDMYSLHPASFQVAMEASP